MGVEGKDKAKVLEAGAASLSNQLGQAVLKLRKGYGLSLADLSQHSGVAKSIISQIERNETNPTLTTIWRLAHALDVSIESMLRGTEEGPFIEHLGRGTTPIFVSDDGLCRLAVIGWLKTVDWLQWYDFQADPGGVLESAAHLRGSVECLSVLDGELEVEVGETTAAACAGETLRYRCDMPHRIRNLEREAGPRHDGVHSQGGDDGLKAAARAGASGSDFDAQLPRSLLSRFLPGLPTLLPGGNCRTLTDLQLGAAGGALPRLSGPERQHRCGCL